MVLPRRFWDPANGECLMSGTAQNKKDGFRSDIEGMRGIAVLLVVLFHSGVPGFGGGYVGVDVFFALSGYLITGIILNEIAKRGKLNFRNFYARRARRLLPAAGLVVVCTLLLIALLSSPLELARFAKWASFTSLYASNVMFLRDASNYFASDVTKNPYLHTWSLAVEEQFYLFWPGLIALTLMAKKARRRHLAIVLAVISTVSLATCILLTNYRAPWAFFSLPTRAWEFGLGGLGYMLPVEWLARRKNLVAVAGWLGFAALLAGGSLFTPQTAFPGFSALIPVLGTITVLTGWLSGLSWGPGLLLGIRPLQYLGRLSYSWYLWHWPILLLTEVRFPEITWTGKLLASLLALVLANITFITLEKPVRFHPFLVARPALSLCLAPLVAIIGVTASLVCQGVARHELASEPQASFWAAANDQRILFQGHCLTPSGSSRLAECTHGDRSSNTVIVLFGDSHAEHWFPALDRISSENHWRLLTLLKSSCPAADVTVFNAHLKREDKECSVWRQAALTHIARLHPFLVVVSESDQPVAESGQTVRAHSISPADWERGLRATVSYLDSRDFKTIVIADVPRHEFDVPTCLSRAAVEHRSVDDCSVPRSAALNEDARRAERAAMSGLNNARLVDLVNQFCPGQNCPTWIEGQVVFRDRDHLTSSFSQSLAPVLKHEIDGFSGAVGEHLNVAGTAN
jgi:peptidoglycan/LPS O-acetylase OafA/YrhL